MSILLAATSGDVTEALLAMPSRGCAGFAGTAV
jgi:hypothetical protein